MGGEEATADDQENMKSMLSEAKDIMPEHDTIQMFEADNLCIEGKSDEALAICDRLQAKSADNDAQPHLIRANVLAHAAMLQAQTAQQTGNQAGFMEAQKSFESANTEYENALKKEPYGVEIHAQYANYKSVM